MTGTPTTGSSVAVICEQTASLFDQHAYTASTHSTCPDRGTEHEGFVQARNPEPTGPRDPTEPAGPTNLTDGERLIHVEMVMGTAVSFAVFGSLTENGDRRRHSFAHRAISEACAVLHAADDVFSTWNPWSPMSLIRRGAARLDDFSDEVASQLAAVLALSWEVRQATNGWFDPWAMTGGVDPTGLVKGWAVERAACALERLGMEAIVNGGGDIVTCGTPSRSTPIRIGVRHPWRAGSLACVVAAGPSFRAVATSGCYERGAHLVDPHSKQRTHGAVASATVVGEDLGVADAFATAFAVGGEAALAASTIPSGYEAYLIGHEGGEFATSGFPFA